MLLAILFSLLNANAQDYFPIVDCDDYVLLAKLGEDQQILDWRILNLSAEPKIEKTKLESIDLSPHSPFIRVSSENASVSLQADGASITYKNNPDVFPPKICSLTKYTPEIFRPQPECKLPLPEEPQGPAKDSNEGPYAGAPNSPAAPLDTSSESQPRRGRIKFPTLPKSGVSIGN